MIHLWWMRPRLQAYLDDALPPGKREGVERHLSRCAACTETLRLMRVEEDLLRAARPEPWRLSAEASDAILERALAGMPSAPARPARRGLVPALAAACLLLGLIYLGWTRLHASSTIRNHPPPQIVNVPKRVPKQQPIPLPELPLQPVPLPKRDIVKHPQHRSQKLAQVRGEPALRNRSARRMVAFTSGPKPVNHPLPDAPIRVAVRQGAGAKRGYAYVRAYDSEAQGRTAWHECRVTELPNGKESACYTVSAPHTPQKLVLAVTQREASVP